MEAQMDLAFAVVKRSVAKNASDTFSARTKQNLPTYYPKCISFLEHASKYAPPSIGLITSNYS